MKIKQDPITGLWAREDGAVLLPPAGRRFKTFHWTFGSSGTYGYKVIHSCGTTYRIHRIICRAFHGLPPEGKPEVDHINRCPSDNRPENLRWVNRKENNDNRDYVDESIERFGTRECEDEAAYRKAYNKSYSAKMKAQGLTWRKGPNGKWGWFPRIRT